MIKKVLFASGCLFLLLVCIFYINNKSIIITDNLSFSINDNQDRILNKVNKKYTLSNSTLSKDLAEEEEIKQLSRKTTYLILGNLNSKNDSSVDYYNRHKQYLDMAAYNYFPRNKNSKSGYDESNPLYKYAMISELAIPQLFNKFNELDIAYNSYGNIRVTINDNLVISTVVLPNVEMKEENINNLSEYKVVKTNLIIYYYFIKIDGKYRLTYLYGESTDNINNYFNEVENKETGINKAISSYDSNLSNLYNFDKLNSMSDKEFNNIYDINAKNIVYLQSYFDNKIISSANGVFINNGIILTTWSFLEESLSSSQYLTVKDTLGKFYGVDGIVTVNPETDIAVIKLKQNSNTSVKLGNNDYIKIENPAIAISSKTGTSFSIQKGIIISNDNYIHTSIPLTKSDEGSPLFDRNGNVIGINTSKLVNSNVSISINLSIIKEIQDKFNSIEFNSIKVISFDKLKNEYYTKYDNEKILNNISKYKWSKYKKIGNIEKNIKLKLVKANYKDGIVSLRYKNNISKYVSSMQLSASFKNQLLKDGYKTKLESTSKCIYENTKYQIIIMEEFNYLIIVMVKL